MSDQQGLFLDKKKVDPFPEAQQKLLLVMASMGASHVVTASLLKLASFKNDHVDFLLGPIIQHKTQWMETTPPWMYEQTHSDRLKVIFREHNQGIVTTDVGPTEIATVMYPATMEAPMRYQAAQLYLWASAQASAEHRNIPLTEMYNMLSMAPIEDSKILDKEGEFYQEYRQLCQEIRRKVVAAGAQRRKQLNKPEPVTEPPPVQVKGEQLDLF